MGTENAAVARPTITGLHKGVFGGFVALALHHTGVRPSPILWLVNGNTLAVHWFFLQEIRQAGGLAWSHSASALAFF